MGLKLGGPPGSPSVLAPTPFQNNDFSDGAESLTNTVSIPTAGRFINFHLVGGRIEAQHNELTHPDLWGLRALVPRSGYSTCWGHGTKLWLLVLSVHSLLVPCLRWQHSQARLPVPRDTRLCPIPWNALLAVPLSHCSLRLAALEGVVCGRANASHGQVASLP